MAEADAMWTCGNAILSHRNLFHLPKMEIVRATVSQDRQTTIVTRKLSLRHDMLHSYIPFFLSIYNIVHKNVTSN